MAWDPQQYLKFGNERLRPAQDLIARIPLASPRCVVDLGCGTGAVTALVHARWPKARVIGIDHSEAMLERARSGGGGIEWQHADLAHWAPHEAVDLIVSNAALHWLDDHGALFPRLVSYLTPGGVLAVQMPAQHDAPSHRLAYDLAESAHWSAVLGPLVRRRPILPPAAYYDVLRPLAATLELWFTEYVQSLTGEHPVVEFTKGSFVGLWLSVLTQAEAAQFEAAYRDAIARAYPRQRDGVTLFPFRRFFLIAQRR